MIYGMGIIDLCSTGAGGSGVLVVRSTDEAKADSEWLFHFHGPDSRWERRAH